MPEAKHKECEECIFGRSDLCGTCDLKIKDKTGLLRNYPGAKPCCDCVNPCSQARKLMRPPMAEEGHERD